VHGAFGLYRGTRAATGVFEYYPVCLGGPVGSPEATDPEVPARGTAFYYLATAIGCSESSLGVDSAGAPRPNIGPCVAPATQP
jgi:hypothetical protein